MCVCACVSASHTGACVHVYLWLFYPPCLISRVQHVDKGGPAEEAGLKPDMVITYVNGEVRVWDGIHISCLLVLLCMCCLHAVVVVIYRK